MTSKGIDAFAYVSNPRFKVVFDARGYISEEFSSPGVFHNRHYEINNINLDAFEWSGRFTMHALKDRNGLLQKWVDVSPCNDGAVGTENADNLNGLVQSQKSVVVPGYYAASYGFIDAGGYAGCSDRAYMYLTDDFSDWMGKLQLADATPFGQFVLPGAHEAGMFRELAPGDDLQSIAGVAQNYWHNYSDEAKGKIAAGGVLDVAAITGMLGAISSIMAGDTGAGMAAIRLRRALTNLVNTQKDTVAVQLLLGIRFFDFRPGYNINGKDKILRHQHNFVPGCLFEEFLTAVVSFLGEHPAEIVVVNINFAGFINPDVMKPSPDHVAVQIDQALSCARNAMNGQRLQLGNVDSLKETYRQLVQENRRLIILGDEPKRDSSSDAVCQTQDVTKVMAALDSTLNQPESAWTCLQLQGRCNGTTCGAVSDASSTLILPKVNLDHVTFPWVHENVAKRCGTSLCVLLNDCADNALTDLCIDLTKQRCNVAIPEFSVEQKVFTIPATSYDSDSIFIGRSQVGEDDFICNTHPLHTCFAYYSFTCAGGSVPTEHRLEFDYAAAESLPVIVTVNDTLVSWAALRKITGGWHADNRQTEVVGFVKLRPGKNLLKIQSPGAIPGINEIRFVRADPACSQKADSVAQLAGHTPAGKDNQRQKETCFFTRISN